MGAEADTAGAQGYIDDPEGARDGNHDRTGEGQGGGGTGSTCISEGCPSQIMAFQSNSRMRTTGTRPLAVEQAERWAPRRPTLAALTWKPTQDNDAQAAAVEPEEAFREGGSDGIPETQE
ncbi:hypothetical protein CYMTET_46442 [Cymbomonas tetramitiformis]|uniref:Uncharacterized protein n=1 Tax=Cymbomonas tetramitiformis TaxID=36881 RepID=A0AAE0BY56_9CHLO|nr:hypothetical protein CYMTET_46442 [Cymbomonas tetramitiformis]